MPAPILSGMVTFLEGQLSEDGVKVHDGEIPRWDEDGSAIDLPADQPILRILMPKEGFGRDNETFEDAHNDQGNMLLEVYGATREQVEEMLNTLEAALLLQSNWPAIDLDTAYEVSNVLVIRWGCYQLEEARTKTGTYVYYGFLSLQIGVNGTVRSR